MQETVTHLMLPGDFTCEFVRAQGPRSSTRPVTSRRLGPQFDQTKPQIAPLRASSKPKRAYDFAIRRYGLYLACSWTGA